MAEQHLCIDCRVECTCFQEPCALCIDCHSDEVKERAAIRVEHLTEPEASDNYRVYVYGYDHHSNS